MDSKETKQIVDGLIKGNWKEDHLDRKHTKFYDWCQLCMAKQKGINDKKGFSSDLGIDVEDGVKTEDLMGK